MYISYSSFCPKTPATQTPSVNLMRSRAEILKEITTGAHLLKLQKKLFEVTGVFFQTYSLLCLLNEKNYFPPSLN